MKRMTNHSIGYWWTPNDFGQIRNSHHATANRGKLCVGGHGQQQYGQDQPGSEYGLQNESLSCDRKVKQVRGGETRSKRFHEKSPQSDSVYQID